MRTHELKCWPEPFQATLDGIKTHEWRRDDRGFAVGDVLELLEWDPTFPPGQRYPYRRLRVVVTYITRGQFGVPDGFCVMSIKKEGGT